MPEAAEDFFSVFAPAKPVPAPPQNQAPTMPAIPAMAVARSLLMPFQERAVEMEKEAQITIVEDEESQVAAVALAGRIKKAGKAIEDTRKAYVGPFNAHVKEVNALAGEIRFPLERAEKELKKKLNSYAAQQELERRKVEEEARKRAQEEQEKLNREAAAAGVEAPTVPEIVEPESSATVRTASGTAYMQSHWSFELEDIAKVPPEYLALDEKKVRAAIKAGVRQIPGLTIFEQKSMAIRS